MGVQWWLSRVQHARCPFDAAGLKVWVWSGDVDGILPLLRVHTEPLPHKWLSA
jgi:hypothetical protein